MRECLLQIGVDEEKNKKAIDMKKRLILCIGWLAVVQAGYASTNYPSWWLERQVIDTNLVSADYAPANQGQAKHVAHRAWLEFEQKLGGAGSVASDLVSRFTVADNDRSINLGQLKTMAAPFYDRLSALEFTQAWPANMTVGPYPWSGSITPANDSAIANIGQLKYLFSFDLFSVALDSDGDGLPDWWENGFFGALTQDGDGDFDGDGIINRFEQAFATDPTVDQTATEPEGVYRYDLLGRLVEVSGAVEWVYTLDAEGNLQSVQ